MVRKHASTKFWLFFFMYNSVPTLPIDVKYNLVDIEGNENELPFEKKKRFMPCLQIWYPWEQTYIK